LITQGGVVTTLAGSAGVWGSADGTGSTAQFGSPQGVAVDGAGNVYVADTDNSTIRMITQGGVVTTLAGSAGVQGSADGIGSTAQFNRPVGVAVDGAGNVYVADKKNNAIRKINSAGVVTTPVGTLSYAIVGTFPGPLPASLVKPYGIALASSGSAYIVLDSAVLVASPAAVTPATAVPTFTPAPGEYPGPLTISLADATPGAAIYYTTDGSLPTATSPLYTGPIPITETVVLQAIAVAPGHTASGVAGGTYSVFGAPLNTSQPYPVGPLALSVLWPQQGFTITTSSVSVQGDIVSGTPPVTLTVNGSVVPSSAGGMFVTMVGAEIGPVSIVVQGTDGAGSTATLVVGGVRTAPANVATCGQSTGVLAGGQAGGGAPSGFVRFLYDPAGNLIRVINTAQDVNNCGNVGTVCNAVGGVPPACLGGLCGILNGGGQFIQAMCDPGNCGPSGVACAAPGNGIASCVNGACAVQCNPGYIPSGSQCVDPRNDPYNCRELNNVCPGADSGMAICTDGMCGTIAAPQAYAVNGVSPPGVAFRSPMWKGVEVLGEHLDNVTYLELEDWGGDSSATDLQDPIAPNFTGRVVSGSSRAGIPNALAFETTPESLTIPAATLQYLMGKLWADEWYKVRLHYSDHGVDQYVTINVAVSLDDQAPVQMGAPAFSSVSMLRQVRTLSGYDPATGFITMANGNTDDIDPTGYATPPTAVLAYNDPLQTEHPIYAITSGGVYISAGLDPSAVQKTYGEFTYVTLVLPYNDPSTDRVDLGGSFWGSLDGGVIIRGKNLAADGMMNVANPVGNAIPGNLSSATYLGDRAVIRPVVGVQDAFGYVAYQSPRGAANTSWPITWLHAPVIESVGSLPYITYDRVLNVTGHFFVDVNSVIYASSDMAEVLSPAVASPPGPEQFYVVDDRNIQVMLSSAGRPVPRQLSAHCDPSQGLIVDTFPGQRTIWVVNTTPNPWSPPQPSTGGGYGSASLAAVDPSSPAPAPPVLSCPVYSPGPSGGSTNPNPPVGTTVPLNLFGVGGGGCGNGISSITNGSCLNP
jgi:hypothetical protein